MNFASERVNKESVIIENKLPFLSYLSLVSCFKGVFGNNVKKFSSFIFVLIYSITSSGSRPYKNF